MSFDLPFGRELDRKGWVALQSPLRFSVTRYSICLATDQLLIAAWKEISPVTSHWRPSKCIYAHPSWIYTTWLNKSGHRLLLPSVQPPKADNLTTFIVWNMSNAPFDPPPPGASASVNRSTRLAISDCSQDVETTDHFPRPPCYDFPASSPIAYPRSRIEASEPTCPPSYHDQQSAQESPRYDMSLSSPTISPMMSEELPTYSKTSKEEPNTLAKVLWKWGFLCPLLWFIGMTL